jgi:hypothetical protein
MSTKVQLNFLEKESRRCANTAMVPLRNVLLLPVTTLDIQYVISKYAPIIAGLMIVKELTLC